jgi:hypothetical protein
LSNLISLCQKHKVDNYIFESFEKLFLFVKNNILSFDGGRKLYLPNVNLSDKRVWFMYLHNIGSPLIRYKKVAPLLYGPTKKIESELVTLLGLSKTLSSMQASAEFDCAFREDYNICKAKHIGLLCLTQPYLVTNPEKDGTECLFYNSIKLLGMEGRIED